VTECDGNGAVWWRQHHFSVLSHSPARKEERAAGSLDSNYRPKPIAFTNDNTTQQSSGDVRGGWSDRVEGSTEVKEDEDGEELMLCSHYLATGSESLSMKAKQQLTLVFQ